MLHQHRRSRLRAGQPARNRKGALFARCSRSLKSLRRLFLDEFLPKTGAPLTADAAAPDRETASAAVTRAGSFTRACSAIARRRLVAQLGGVHVACEDASNILTKLLEWGRLMAALEQSTRYIAYTQRRADHWRYHVPAELDDVSALRARYLDPRYRLCDLRDVDRADAECFRARSEGGGRLRCRLPVSHPREGSGHAPRSAAGGDAVERRHLPERARLTRRCCSGSARAASPRRAPTPI